MTVMIFEEEAKPANRAAAVLAAILALIIALLLLLALSVGFGAAPDPGILRRGDLAAFPFSFRFACHAALIVHRLHPVSNHAGSDKWE